MLFILYTQPLFNLVSKHAVNHHAFADDNQLYKISALDAIPKSDTVCVCVCVCACAFVRSCVRARVCVCVVSIIVKRPLLPPSVVDGRSRNPLYYYYYYQLSSVKLASGPHKTDPLFPALQLLNRCGLPDCLVQ